MGRILVRERSQRPEHGRRAGQAEVLVKQRMHIQHSSEVRQATGVDVFSRELQAGRQAVWAKRAAATR